MRLIAASGHTAISLTRRAERPGDVAIGDLAAAGIREIPACDALVHLAGRAHVMNEEGGEALAAYRNVNVIGTLCLLRAALEAGTRRFVFVSTIKVLGEQTAPGVPFTTNAVPSPADPYAVSKWEAEQAVTRFCTDHNIEWSIVRPVLVFGPQVKANFAQLMRLVLRGIPLPLASIANLRSFAFVDNLSAFLLEACYAEASQGRALNFADAPAVSTPQLIHSMAHALGVQPRLFACPPPVLELAAGIGGRGEAARRLTRSLQVDTAELSAITCWHAPVPFERALEITANWLSEPAAKLTV